MNAYIDKSEYIHINSYKYMNTYVYTNTCIKYILTSQVFKVECLSKS